MLFLKAKICDITRLLVLTDKSWQNWKDKSEFLDNFSDISSGMLEGGRQGGGVAAPPPSPVFGDKGDVCPISFLGKPHRTQLQICHIKKCSWVFDFWAKTAWFNYIQSLQKNWQGLKGFVPLIVIVSFQLSSRFEFQRPSAVFSAHFWEVNKKMAKKFKFEKARPAKKVEMKHLIFENEKWFTTT